MLRYKLRTLLILLAVLPPLLAGVWWFALPRNEHFGEWVSRLIGVPLIVAFFAALCFAVVRVIRRRST